MSHVFDPERMGKLESDERLEELPAERFADELRGDDILDLGCGPGLYTSEVAELKGGRVHGADLQEPMLRRCFQKGMPEGVRLVRCVGNALPYRTGSLTSAYSIHVLHEFADDGTLEEVERVLEPGGRFVVIDWMREEMERGPPVDHRISSGRAVEMLEAAGFSVEGRDVVGDYNLFVAST